MVYDKTKILDGLLEIQHETRAKEFKSAFGWEEKPTQEKNIRFQEKLIQTVLAMSNLKQGGYIIIGIKENPFCVEGLTQQQSESYQNYYESIKNEIDSFCYTNTNFEIWPALKNNKKLIIFNVRTFDEIPVICRKDGKITKKDKKHLLEKDIIYSRTISGQAGNCIVTDRELKEIIRISMSKEITKYEEMGLIIQSYKQKSLKAQEKRDTRMYNNEIMGFIKYD